MATRSFRHDILGVKPSTASPLDSVLLIIDAQNEYAKGQLQITDLAPSRAAIASLLRKYRESGGNIVHILHVVPHGAPIFTPDTDLETEFEELTPLEGEQVIRKKYPGSFAETDLHEYLRSISASKLVLCGYMAHVCVSTTAREASQLGYDVVIAEDAVGDRDIPGIDGRDLTRVAMLELHDAFGTVINSTEIV